MGKKTISVPDDLLAKMGAQDNVNWSGVAAAAFERWIKRRDRDPRELGAVGYAAEKLSGALTTLQGLGTIQERLRDALSYNIIHVPIDGVPEDYREQFAEMREACTRTPSENEGSIAATCLPMSEDEAIGHVSTIDLTAYMTHRHYAELTGD